MRAATNAILAVVATAASLAACKKQEPAEQNISIDNGIDPGADIETVPPDEAVTDEGENFADTNSAQGPGDGNGV